MISVKTLLVLSTVMATTLAMKAQDFADMQPNEVSALQTKLTKPMGNDIIIQSAKLWKKNLKENYALEVQKGSDNPCFLLIEIDMQDNPPSFKVKSEDEEAYEPLRESFSVVPCEPDIDVELFSQFRAKYPKLDQLGMYNKQKATMGMYKVGLGELSKDELDLEAQMKNVSTGTLLSMKKIARGNNAGSWQELKNDNYKNAAALFDNTGYKGKIHDIYQTNNNGIIFAVHIKTNDVDCFMFIENKFYPNGFKVFPVDQVPRLNFGCSLSSKAPVCDQEMAEHAIDSISQQSLIVYKPFEYQDNVWYDDKVLYSGAISGTIFGMRNEEGYALTKTFKYMYVGERTKCVAEVTKWDNSGKVRIKDTNFQNCLIFFVTPKKNTSEVLLLVPQEKLMNHFGRDQLPEIPVCPPEFVKDTKQKMIARAVETQKKILGYAESKGELFEGYEVIKDEFLESTQNVINNKMEGTTVHTGVFKLVEGGFEMVILVTYAEDTESCKMMMFLGDDLQTVKLNTTNVTIGNKYKGTFKQIHECSLDRFTALSNVKYIPQNRLLLI